MMLFSLPVVIGLGGHEKVPCTTDQLRQYDRCLARMGDIGFNAACDKHLQSTSLYGDNNQACFIPEQPPKHSRLDNVYADRYSESANRYSEPYDRYSNRANQAKLGSGLLGSSFGYDDAQTYGSSLDDYAQTYGASLDDYVQTYGSSLDDYAQTYGSSLDDAQTYGSSLDDYAQTYGSSFGDAQTYGSSFGDAETYGSSFGDAFLGSSQKTADFRLGEPRASRNKREAKRAQKSNRRESRSSFRLGNSFNNGQKADRKTRRSQRFGSSRNAKKAGRKTRRSRLESTRLGEEFGDDLASGAPVVSPFLTTLGDEFDEDL